MVLKRERFLADPTLADLDAIREDCRRLVTRRAAMSSVVAATPLPFIDAAADVGILLRLLPKITEKFALTPAEIEDLDPESRLLVFAAIKRLGDTLVGKLITRETILFVLRRLGVRVATKSVTRFAPLIGQATAASLSFWMMRHIGLKHIDDCYTVARARAEARLFGEGAVVIDAALETVESC